MKYIIQFSAQAFKDFKRISRPIQKRLINKLELFCRQKNPLFYATKLKDSQFGTYRFRIGDYRAIFDIAPQGYITILYLLSIKHRKEAYNL